METDAISVVERIGVDASGFPVAADRERGPSECLHLLIVVNGGGECAGAVGEVSSVFEV